MNWQNHPLIRLITPFTLGMVGANLFMPYMNLVVLFILCCAFLALSFFLLNTSKTFKDWKFGMTASTFAFLVGMTLYTGKHQRIANSIPQDTTFCQGILTEAPTKKPNSWALNLQQENGTHILLYISPLQREHLPSIGDTILASPAHFNSTHTCPNDSFKTYHNYLFNNGVCATAYAPQGRWIIKPCHTHQDFLTSLRNMQGTLHTIYDNHGINGEAGTIIEAMTIGQKTNLSKETRTAYAHAGVSHVLALSGFHVGIIVLMLQFFSLKHMLSLRWRWISNLVIAVALWCYALLTGLSPSLVRATLMCTILLLSQSTFRNDLSLNSCAQAFLIMLCINPFYLHDIGFQLSFIAVGSIGILGKKLITLASFHNNLAYYAWLITIIAISLISTLFTAPLVAYHFGHVSTLALLSNLLLFPFVYLLMFASILWWAFLWCPPISDLLTTLLNWTATTMNTISETIASIPFSTMEWHPNLATTLLCYAILLTLTYFITHKKIAL